MATHQHAHRNIIMPINIVTRAIEKENTRYQRKLKIAASAIFEYASRLMHLKIKAGILQNLQCPTKKDYKLYTNTSKIICNLVSNQQPQRNTCKCVDKAFRVFKECMNRSKCKESSHVGQLAALQVETQEVGNCKQ